MSRRFESDWTEPLPQSVLHDHAKEVNAARRQASRARKQEGDETGIEAGDIVLVTEGDRQAKGKVIERKPQGTYLVKTKLFWRANNPKCLGTATPKMLTLIRKAKKDAGDQE